MAKRTLLTIVALGLGMPVWAGDAFAPKALETRLIRPAAVKTLADGAHLFDFGKDAFGWVELVPPTGTRGAYELRLGELLSADGHVNLKPGATIRAATVRGTVSADGVLRVPMVADRRNTSGGREGGAAKLPPAIGVVAPLRYVEVVSAPFAVTRDSLRMIALNYPMAMDESAFTCDDARLNRIYDFCKHTIRATSFAGLYIDGDRERIPYEGDAYLNQLGEYAVHSDPSLARKSLRYLMDHPTWPTEWKQHAIMMAWEDWRNTGDTRFIRERYDQLKAEKLYLGVRRADGLLVTGGERNPNALTNRFGAADLVDWPPHERDGFVFCDVNAVINAFHYRNLLEMSDLAAALGKTDDAAQFAAEAARVKEAYSKAFLWACCALFTDGEGTHHVSLHANVAALAFGLAPDGLYGRIADHLASRGMVCSVYFAQYLLEALFKAGRADAALQLMTASGDRSWLGMLDQGATMTMEAWNVAAKPNLDLNHAWGTAPLNVISRYVLGVTPLEPGFAKILVRPQLGGLKAISGTVPTIRGAVKVKVEKNVLTVEVPAPARIEFGGIIREVPAGRHEIGGRS